MPWGPGALDVTDDAQISEVVAAAGARFGRLDILVNNAWQTIWDGTESRSTASVRDHRYRDDGRDPRRGQGRLRSLAHRVCYRSRQI
ncbi:short chain dehydrogenase [Mycobacteroides abscessus subsp. abscessus]|nr:short chain dehydrogenase [Mycobacteroides abscessus subsp. abscessus]